MAILAECDICGNQHRVKDALGGHSIRCKACGVQIAVRAGNVISPERFIEEGGRLRRRPIEQSAQSWTWIFFGLVTMALIGLMVGALIVCATFIRLAPKHQVQSMPVGGCRSRFSAKE